eukprot:TRINITY_DN5690_c0_g1_i2.p1 TRINITY_DN5690_c0_g1~~TRINITY_DN5690_c0_g1_i2.p1  ORF type:complete len:258 (-),score=45.08 TRINITY_DN5690_c0_g1_i2:19-792(-)
MLLLYAFSIFWLSGSMLLSFLLLASPFTLLSGIQLLWLSCIIIPLMCAPVIITRREKSQMQLIPAKNIAEYSKVRRYMVWCALRIVPLIIASVAIFIVVVYLVWPDSTFDLFAGFDTGVRSDGSYLYNSKNFDDALIFGQNVLMFMFVYYLVFMSLGFMYHHQSIFRPPIKINLVFLFASSAVILLQVIWFAFSMIGRSSSMFSRIHWAVYVGIFLFPIVIVGIDEMVKIKQREYIDKNQRELKLDFDTKLGKYSPK